MPVVLKLNYSAFVFGLILGLGPWSWSFSLAKDVPGQHAGYLESTREERYQRDYELVFYARPPQSSQGFLSAPLVNDKLTREFSDRFEREFGRTDSERTHNAINRFTFYGYPSGSAETVERYTNRQRRFGEYMVRRVVEEHVDRFAKSNPEVRPIYELKDRIANVNVEVRRGYKVKLHYSYSGNYLDIKLDNPTPLRSLVTLQMDQDAIGPSKIEESTVKLSYPFESGVLLSTYYETIEGGLKLVGEKRLTPALSTTLTAASQVRVDKDVRESERHDLVLLGFSWTE